MINIYTRTSLEKFQFHGVRASKRMCISTIILSILLFLSYLGSSYEYKNIHHQYEVVHDEIAKKVGHHIEPGSKMTSERNRGAPADQAQTNTTNSTDDDVESFEDFEKESSSMFLGMFFGPAAAEGGKFNMTHFLEQSKKRAKAIVQNIDY